MDFVSAWKAVSVALTGAFGLMGLAAGAGLNQSLLRERRKLPFTWRRLDHLGERFSIVKD
jgi:hypothetical protein